MHPDGGTDLVEPHFPDTVSLAAQDFQGMIPKGRSFLHIISIAYTDTEAVYAFAAVPQVFQQKLQGFLRGTLTAPANA